MIILFGLVLWVVSMAIAHFLVFADLMSLWSVWVAATWGGAVVGATFGALDRFGVDVAMATFFASVVAGSELNAIHSRRS